MPAITGTTISAHALDITALKGLSERRNDFASRTKLVANVAAIAGRGNRRADRRVVQLLLIVQIVSTRVAGGVKMADRRTVLLDRPDQVSLHDLHVVNIV